MDPATRKRVSLKNPVHFLSLGFGSGLIPLMPGTFGTLAGLPLVYLLSFTDFYTYLAVTIAVSLVGIWLCGKTAHDMQVHDHGSIVWDEIAGLLVTMLAVPVTALTLFLGFVLFRVFDIWKPWPISLFDKYIGGGLGIMLDDIIAGLFALGGMHLLLMLGLIPL